MESLGGDQLWVDRFLAQHAAIIYFVILILLFAFAPAMAYNFSELIEAHAVDTYGVGGGKGHVLCVVCGGGEGGEGHAQCVVCVGG